jgi:hypothetical protein
MNMSVVERAQFALQGFMTGNPEPVPSGHRVFFGIEPFPIPRAAHLQWDDGDGTARALDAWLLLRAMTADCDTGADVEAGQWRYLLSLINPATGLVAVADLSHPHREGCLYHCWDQGRTLRHLVNRYLGEPARERSKTESMIVSMIAGLKRLSSRKALPDGKAADYWEYEAYRDDRPLMKDTDYDFTYAWAIANGQLLDPACAWASMTGSKQDLDWAMRLAAGFVAGLETRRGSTTPMFGPGGQFYGHFHCAASSLVGLVHLAHLLIRRASIELGKAYLDTAVRAYRWIFSEGNRNRGGSHGWFPESSAKRQSCISEICCTADMIELASALASTAGMIEGYEDLDVLWDDVDRFTRNELCQMQILNPDKLLRWLDPATSEAREAFRLVAGRYRGGWSFGHAWPHELMDFDKDSRPEFDPAVLRVPIGGCCSYSGPRGLHAYWKAGVDIRPGEIEIRFPMDYESQTITVAEVGTGGLRCTVRKPSRVLVRIPGNVEKGTVRVMRNGLAMTKRADPRSGRLIVDSEPGTEYSVTWDNPEWTSHETLGPANDGHLEGMPVGSRITYSLTYGGNSLKEMTPREGALLPYEDGL